MPDRAAERVLDAWTDRLQPLAEERARAAWAAALDASPENCEAVEAASRRLEAARRDAAGFARIRQSLDERIDDPTLRRALEVLERELHPWQVPRPDALPGLEAEAQAHFARFRATVGGKRLAANEVVQTLRTSSDTRTCERAWRAAVEVGTGIAEKVREMARLRNEHARALGHADFRALELETREVDAARLDAFLEALARGTDEAWARQKADLGAARAQRFSTAVGELGPWHMGDVFLQTPPPEGDREDPFLGADPVELARRTFARVGLDVEQVLEASDLFPREGKDQHAFCTHLDRRGDVRVLANVVPTLRWVRTMLHELGHAAYDLGIDRDLPWALARPPHPCVTEGVAMLFGRLADDPAWLSEIAGLPADADAEREGREALLCFVRWGLVVSTFEKHLYADPEADLDRVFWDLVERFQGVRRPDPCPVGAWAAKIHVACHPVYYASYLLGETVASQLARRLEDAPGAAFLRPQTGVRLGEHVFVPGALRPWEELVEAATGRALDAGALLEDALPRARSL